MVVLDRAVDMVTPMCTQLTYEGLVDEVVGIHNCEFVILQSQWFVTDSSPPATAHVEVDPILLNPTPAASTSAPSSSSFGAPPPKKRKHLLSSSSDPLFAELRDKNFAVVGAVLNRTARKLNDDYERRHQAKTTTELRQFVGQLGGLQAEHQALRLRASCPSANEVLRLTRQRRHGLDGADSGCDLIGRVQRRARGAAK